MPITEARRNLLFHTRGGDQVREVWALFKTLFDSIYANLGPRTEVEVPQTTGSARCSARLRDALP